MKTYIYITVLLLCGTWGMLRAQHSLERDLNLPRAGEEIIKQQVEYKNPGRIGENVLWDFGQLKSINDEYTLSYSEPVPLNDSIYILGLDTIAVGNLAGDKLLVGTEHHTMYYYYLGKNRMWTIGHENPVTVLKYTEPLIAAVYPMQYGDSCRRNYQSQGLYSSQTAFTTDGEAQIKADAYGMMILPSGDTLRNVFRTHTEQSIHQVFIKGDSSTVEYNSSIETYKWFSKGYRYPIFETVRTFIIEDSGKTVNFETAFFYPPQEHYYLENDEENLAVLDSLNLNGNNKYNPLTETRYNVFPNPVSTMLHVEVFLPVEAKIRIQVRSVNNKNVYINENPGKFTAGTHEFQLGVSHLPPGHYLVNIWADNYLLDEVILKQ